MEGKRVERKELLRAKIIVATLIVILLIAMITVAGWRAHWWIAQSSANHRAHVTRSGYANQQTLRDQITLKLGDVTDLDSQIIANPSNKAQLIAQRRAIADIVCQDAEQVTGDALPANQVIWVNNNCVMGSAK